MTELLFRGDPYLAKSEAEVVSVTGENGIILDRTVFYPTSGGQSGDRGQLCFGDNVVPIATTAKGENDTVVLVPEPHHVLPAVGAKVMQTIDWERRHRMMRLHTALHLLSVVIPLPVTGGQITAEKGRLDFNMPEAPENREALEQALNDLIAQDHQVSETWITDQELDSKPELVKTMSVAPPRGTGRIRLVQIGTGTLVVDLQPCGGTHVRSTGEIGSVRFGKIEKKGRQNRRVNLFLHET